MTAKQVYRIGTRKSRLAQIQTDGVIARLQAAFPTKQFEKVLMETRGDLDRTTDLVQMGGQGVFVKAIQEALLAGEIDMAVHSAKDLPSVEPAGLVLGAFPERQPVGDSLILRSPFTSLAALPTGAVVGTSSRRRRFQLAAVRPDLRLEPLRGNIDTRLEKLTSGQYDAIVMAQAGIRRYGLPIKEQGLTEFQLPVAEFLPAVGQGAIAVECRAESQEEELLRVLDDPAVRLAVTCERAFLAVFGLGCNVPLAGYARLTSAAADSAAADTKSRTAAVAASEPQLLFTGQLGNEADGTELLAEAGSPATVTAAAALGIRVAEQIRAQATFLPE